MRGIPCILLAALAGSAGAAAVEVRIELPAALAVTQPEVRLGDVAALTTNDLPTLKRLMALPLGPAPRAGGRALLARAELGKWIEARGVVRAADIQWEGAAATELHRAASEIPGARIAAVAQDALRAWLAERSTRAEINLTTTPADLPVPVGRSTLRVRPLPAEAAITRRMVAWVDVWVDDRFVRTLPVGFEVQAYGPAYVANGDLPAGARLDAQSVALREVQLAGRAAPLPPSTVLAAPTQLRRPLEDGAPVARGDVETPPAVNRGDWVALRSRAGGIEMESRVEALQSGRVGQTVSVKPARAQAAVAARVVGPGQVEVLQ